MKKIFASKFYAFFAISLTLVMCVQGIAQDRFMVDEIQTHKQPSSNFNIFVIHAFGNGPLLVSLSDVYDYNSNEIIIPGNKKEGFTKFQYKIYGSYRASFLGKTGLSETDTLYVHHYPSGKTISLPIKDLNIIAHINVYSLFSEDAFSDHDYMLGFEIPPEKLALLKWDIYHTFVYIGQENPFSQEPLTPLSWHKIETTKFPATTKNQDKKIFSDWPENINLAIGNTYLSEINGFQYYLQERIENDERLRGRRLLVVDQKTQRVILDQFLSDSESLSAAPLKGVQGYDSISQWSGKLFKNKPPVTFGYDEVTFGCSGIWVTVSNEYIRMNCDNRH